MTRSERKETDAGAGKKKKRKKTNPWVENIESLAVAVILALIIRTFVLEAFVIPTGSMATTLYGNHFEFRCPNCEYKYALGFNPKYPVVPERVRCPMCGVVPREVQPYRPGGRMPSYSGGDRILVNKILYLLDEPRRWDLFVFVNPNVDRNDKPPKTTYIKRLLGLPGETFEILRGDVVVDGKIQRKPDSAQSALWMPVYDVNYVWKQGSAWHAPDGTWRLDGPRLLADCPEGNLTWTMYVGRKNDPDRSGTIYDTYGYDHDLTVPNAPLSATGAGRNVVTDLKVSFDVTGSASGRIVISLRGDEHADNAVIDFAKGTASIYRSDDELKSVRLDEVGLTELSPGKKHNISFSRVDYLLVLAIDGTKALECDVWDETTYGSLVELGEALRLPGHHASGVGIAASGAKLELTDLTIDRDVYYTYKLSHEANSRNYAKWEIPEGHYFAMGDNSPESYDSRYWESHDGTPWIPADHLIGKALVIWWHPRRVRLVH